MRTLVQLYFIGRRIPALRKITPGIRRDQRTPTREVGVKCCGLRLQRSRYSAKGYKLSYGMAAWYLIRLDSTLQRSQVQRSTLIIKQGDLMQSLVVRRANIKPDAVESLRHYPIQTCPAALLRTTAGAIWDGICQKQPCHPMSCLVRLVLL